MLDVLVMVAVAVYVVGIPVSGGVMLKMEPSAPLLLSVIWPVVGLGYMGYRLAP